MFKAVHILRGVKRIKTLFSENQVRDFVRACYKAKRFCRVTDGENECGAVYEHEESGLTWYSI